MGGANVDNIVKITYKNTGGITDINGYEVNFNTYSYMWLDNYEFFTQIDKDNAEFYGKLTLALIFGAFSFWLTISIATGKSIMPAIFVLLAWQTFFYISTQDLYWS